MDYTQYDQLLHPVIVLNKDDEISYFNFICSTLFHSSPRKLSKLKKLEELLVNANYDFAKDLKEARKSKSSMVSPEVTFQNSNGEKTTVICKYIPVGDEVVINLLDFSIERRLHQKYKEQIKELRETHEQIVKADKLTALGEIISGIGHEIGTPLIIVENQLDMLFQSLEKNDIDESIRNTVKLKNEFDRVGKIFSGMKSIVKNQEDQFEVVDISTLIDEVLKLFKDLNTGQNIKIEKKLSGTHWVMANGIKLQQVIINLIKNSIDAMNSGQVKEPRITIEVSDCDTTQTQRVKVIDNGPGVPKEIEESIFEMFYTSKSLSDGTGLGLSISKKIIESFSGQIQLNRTKEGCEFELVIPNVEMGSFTATNKYLTGESDFEDDKILFIGDDAALMNQVHKLLLNKKYIIIFSNQVNDVKELVNFILVDHIVKFIPCDTKDLDAEILDLSGSDSTAQIKEVEKKFTHG